MFVLAILFDLRYPIDDGSCVGNTTESQCLERSSAFGTYCTWGSISDGSSSKCSFQEQEVTLMSIIILGWLQLIISAPLKAFINFVFDTIICAASKRLVEEQIKVYLVILSAFSYTIITITYTNEYF